VTLRSKTTTTTTKTTKTEKTKAPSFRTLGIDDLRVEDARAFAAVPLHAELTAVLRKARYRFRVLPQAKRGVPRGDHALLLNLTYWSVDAGGDVLASTTIPADVVAHVAWHHLAHVALARGRGKKPGRAAKPGTNAKPSADALFLGESIASAYDLFMVGALLRGSSARRSSFLESQVPRIAEVAHAAGVPARAFERMLGEIAAAPERAFGQLRALLFDTTSALFRASSADEAAAILAAAEARPFGALLHHYELSNWVLYARAYGDARPDKAARAVDRALRDADDPIAWLASEWVEPAAS
jgi:hypothetical protein